MTELVVGETVGGFHVIDVLGGGGEGVVYLARDPRLGRRVALKLLGPRATEGFASGEVLARLHHENVVTVYAAGEHAGQTFLAMEYVEGRSLRARLADEGPLEPRAVAAIGAKIAAGLCAAHELGLVHGDLKPGNVLCAAGEAVRVIDFAVGEKGTPAYLSPERSAGAEAGAADDIWALGVLLYEAIAGTRPEPELAPSVARKLEAPTGVREAIALCLAAEPETRPSAACARDLLARASRATGEIERSPFVGLAPYGRADAAVFHGREREIAACLSRLRQDPLLVITGPSGVGKTSLIQAGILPRLARDAPLITLEIVLSDDPLAELAAQLVQLDDADTGDAAVVERAERAKDLAQMLRDTPEMLALLLEQIGAERGAHAAIVVDALERFEDGALDHLVETLVRATHAGSGGLSLILALRDEALPELLRRRALREALSRLFVVEGPDARALTEVLARSVDDAGYRFEDAELLQQLIAAVADEHLSLAMLQFTAERLWAARDIEGRRLLRAVYEELGGVGGALAKHAERAILALRGDELELARQLLIRLLPSEGARPARMSGASLIDRAAAEVGTSRAAAERVLEALVAERLLVSYADGTNHATYCELAHEELLARWPRLADWHEAARELADLCEEVEQAARLWQRRGELEQELWSGLALAEALEGLGDARGLEPLAARFLDQAAQRQRQRLRRRWLGSTGLLLLVATLGVVLGWSLIRHKDPAKRPPTRRALARARYANTSLMQIARAIDQRRPARARARLRRLVDRAEGPIAAARGLWWQLAPPKPWRALQLGKGVVTLRFAGAGPHLVASLVDGRTLVIPLGREAARPTAAPTSTTKPSKAAERVTIEGPRLRVWDRAGQLERTLVSTAGELVSGALDPAGNRVAAGSASGWVQLWRRDSAELVELYRLGAKVRVVALGPRGYLAAASARGAVRIWRRRPSRRASGRPVVDRGHLGPVRFLVADRERLISAGADGSIRWWTHRGQQARVLRGFGKPCGLALSSAALVICAGGTLQRWDSAGRSLRATIRTPPELLARLRAVYQSARGILGLDRRGHLYRLEGGARAPIRMKVGHRGRVLAVAVSSNGEHIVTGGADGAVRLLGGSAVSLLAPVRALVFEDKARADWAEPRWRLAAFDGSGTVTLLEVRGSTLRLVGRRGRISPPARSLARTSPAPLLIWAAGAVVARGRELHFFRGSKSKELSTPITALVADAGGLAVGTRGGTIHRLDGSGAARVFGLPRRVDGSPKVLRVKVLGGGAISLDGRVVARALGATCGVLSGAGLLIGLADGAVLLQRTIERPGGSIPAAGAALRPASTLLPASSSAVSALLALPHGGLLVGHRNGELVLWQTRRMLDRFTARRLYRAKLHGRVSRLELLDQRAWATTELGDQLELDVTAFLAPWSAFVAAIRRAVPANSGSGQRR